MFFFNFLFLSDNLFQHRVAHSMVTLAFCLLCLTLLPVLARASSFRRLLLRCRSTVTCKLGPTEVVGEIRLPLTIISGPLHFSNGRCQSLHKFRGTDSMTRWRKHRSEDRKKKGGLSCKIHFFTVAVCVCECTLFFRVMLVNL